MFLNKLGPLDGSLKKKGLKRHLYIFFKLHIDPWLKYNQVRALKVSVGLIITIIPVKTGHAICKET